MGEMSIEEENALMGAEEKVSVGMTSHPSWRMKLTSDSKEGTRRFIAKLWFSSSTTVLVVLRFVVVVVVVVIAASTT